MRLAIFAFVACCALAAGCAEPWTEAAPTNACPAERLKAGANETYTWCLPLGWSRSPREMESYFCGERFVAAGEFYISDWRWEGEFPELVDAVRSGYHLQEAEPSGHGTTLGGRQAFRFDVSTIRGGYEERRAEVVTLENDRAYLLTYTQDPAQECDDGFESILASWRFKGEVAATIISGQAMRLALSAAY